VYNWTLIGLIKDRVLAPATGYFRFDEKVHH